MDIVYNEFFFQFSFSLYLTLTYIKEYNLYICIYIFILNFYNRIHEVVLYDKSESCNVHDLGTQWTTSKGTD